MEAMNTDTIRQWGKQLSYRDGEIIFRQGTGGQEMYVVLEGEVHISIEQNGKSITVAKLAPGDFFGEMSLLEEMPRSGTATAAGTTRLTMLEPESFRQLAAVDGELMWRVLKVLSGRVRHGNRDLLQRLGRDLQEVKSSINEEITDIAQSIGHIADSARDIDRNEQKLLDNIGSAQGLSKQITQSLGFIHKVTQQTTILSLNARIEAARSGEYGRGFAVVADEIKKLSDQSKLNAERIGELTQAIDEQMQLIRSISQYSAEHSRKQATSTEEMVKAVAQVSQLAQRLAAIAESL